MGRFLHSDAACGDAGVLRRSVGNFPRVLGALLIIGCFAYLARLFTQVFAPGLGKGI
jgi:hypothetical protein